MLEIWANLSLENNPTEKHLEQKHAVILHNN